MPILTINPLHTNIELQILKNDEILFQDILTKNGKEFDSFPEKIHELSEKYRIDEIWCITGPGPFTLMRIITLTLNTLKIAQKIRLKGMWFFDFYHGKHTPILQINASEYLTRKNRTIIPVSISELEPRIYEWYFEKNDFTDANSFIEYREERDDWTRAFWWTEEKNRLDPLYFKAPHITVWSKKNT